jgi:Putative bacterial sensory transduction regulator
MLAPETVEEFLRRDGWHFERVADGNVPTWRSGFRGEVAPFRFYVRLTDNWVFFIIAPFVLTAKSEAASAALFRRLLRLNQDMTLAKFALDSDEDVVLTVEFPTESIDYSEFKDALDVLSYYADRHYLEVLNLAQQEPAKP